MAETSPGLWLPHGIPQALSTPHYPLSSLPTYYIPETGSLAAFKDYIAGLPTTDRPEAFGQHGNAEISYLREDSRVVLDTLLALQPSDAGAWLLITGAAAGCLAGSKRVLLSLRLADTRARAALPPCRCCRWRRRRQPRGAGDGRRHRPAGADP